MKRIQQISHAVSRRLLQIQRESPEHAQIQRWYFSEVEKPRGLAPVTDSNAHFLNLKEHLKASNCKFGRGGKPGTAEIGSPTAVGNMSRKQFSELRRSFQAIQRRDVHFLLLSLMPGHYTLLE
jgi:hypothetical protein